MDELEELKKQLAEEKKKVALLQSEIEKFKLPGKTKLYYSLNRNMNELADMLNDNTLKAVNLDDPKDKTMERMKIIWSSVTALTETVKALGQSSGVGNDDKEKDVPFVETVAETRK